MERYPLESQLQLIATCKLKEHRIFGCLPSRFSTEFIHLAMQISQVMQPETLFLYYGMGTGYLTAQFVAPGGLLSPTFYSTKVSCVHLGVDKHETQPTFLTKCEGKQKGLLHNVMLPTQTLNFNDKRAMVEMVHKTMTQQFEGEKQTCVLVLSWLPDILHGDQLEPGALHAVAHSLFLHNVRVVFLIVSDPDYTVTHGMKLEQYLQKNSKKLPRPLGNPLNYQEIRPDLYAQHLYIREFVPTGI